MKDLHTLLKGDKITVELIVASDVPYGTGGRTIYAYPPNERLYTYAVKVDHVKSFELAPVLISTGTVFPSASHSSMVKEWTVDIVLDQYVVARCSESSAPQIFELAEVQRRLST